MLETPLEGRGFATPPYTTKGEESAFLAALAADSPRVAVEQIGSGAVDGTPLYLVTVGEPGPVAPGTTDSILVVGYQHGGEYATREATIAFVRDLAYTTDPPLVAYLASHPVYVIVTANPDRIDTWQRENKNGVDLNRDHLLLSQPETRAVEATIKRVRPSIVIDTHENDVLTGDIQFGKPTQSWVTPTIRGISNTMHTAVESYFRARGLTPWPHGNVGTPTTISSTVASRHILTLLIEAHHYMFNVQTRIEHILMTYRAVIDFHAANAAAIQAAMASSREEKIAEGNAATTPFNLGSKTLNPPPLAYRITDAQHAATATHRDLFEITTVADGDGWRIPMGQAAQPFIPFLFDPESEWAVAPAERVTRDLVDMGPIVGWGPLNLDGVDYPVAEVSRFDGDTLLPVWAAA